MSDSATTAWVNAVVAAGGTVSATRETIVDNLIVGLKADGVWAKLDRLWLFAAENTQSALRDLKATATAIAQNSPAFTTDRGYKGNASNAWIDSNLANNWGGGSFTRNDACFFAWNNTAGADGGALAGTQIADRVCSIIPQYTDNNLYGSICQHSGSFDFSTVNNLAATGLYLANRTGSTAATIDINGVQKTTSAQPSTALSTTRFSALVALGGGNWSNRQCGCLGLGGSLSSGERTAIYNRLLSYMVSVGNGPGPALHYEFETTGVTDSSGNSNTGTLAGTGTTLVTGQIGNALSFNGSGYVTFTSTSVLGLPSSTSEISVCCWVKTTVTDATMVSLRNTGNGNTVFDLGVGFNGVDNSFTGKPSFIIRDDSGAGLKIITSASAINDGNWHHVVLTRTSGQLLTLYVDGASAASGTDTLTGALTPNVAGSAIAYERIVASLALTGLLDDLRIYNTALTSTEVAALYTAGAGSGVTTLTAAAGSYTLTGASAGLAGKAVAASGSYTITGTAAALLRKQVAAAGSYTITGATAALKRGHVAGAGSYTLTGAAAALKRTQGAPAGSYTLTGTAASFLASDHKVLPAAAGAYNLTGTAAAFQIGGNVVLATDPGAYTLTGTAAGFITVTVIPVTKADISFIGQTVTVVDLVGTEVIPVGKGDILFTGQNIAISTTGEQPPILVGGGGVTVPPWRDLARKKRRRYRALEEIEKRLDQRIERLTTEAQQAQEQVADVLVQVSTAQITVAPDLYGDLLRRQAQVTQMLHEAQRRAERVRQERVELAQLAKLAAEAVDEEEAIFALLF